MRRAVVAGLIVLAAGAVPIAPSVATDPGAPRSDRARREGDERRGIRKLLDDRARSLMRRDKHAFMATVARLSPDFVERQRALFDNLAGVPLRSYRLTAKWRLYGDLVSTRVRRAYPGAQRVALPLTEERYRITGFDDRPERHDLFYTFAKLEGRWLIVGDTDLDPLGLHSARHLWDFDAVTTERTAHFLVLRHPCCPLPAGFVEAAERALTRVDSVISPWRRRVVIEVPASDEELERMLDVTFDVGDFVAFAASTGDGSNGVVARIVASPNALEGRAIGDIEDLLAHELVHVATRRLSGPFVPAFVEEGFAELVGQRETDQATLAADLRAGAFDGKLPRDSEFTSGESGAIFYRYQEALSAVSFFVRRWGMRRFMDFYGHLGARRGVGTAGYHVDQELRDAIGIGFRTFEQRWADSIEG